MIGIGLVGCGRVSRRYLDLPEGMRLVAVTDMAPGRAEVTAAQVEGCVVCDDVNDLVRRDDVDLVIVATPSGTHAEIGMVAAIAHKHVLIEKPIDVDPAKARKLIDICHKRDVVLSVVSQHRFDYDAVNAKAAISNGLPIVLAEGRVWWERPADYYQGWRGTRLLDGGVLMQQGIHTVDLLLWLLGPVARVDAYAIRAFHQMEMEDALVALLLFDCGALATLSVTTAAHPQIPEHVTLTGPAGSLSIESDSSSHKLQLLDVARAISTGCAPSVTGEDGLAALDVVIAAYRSAGWLRWT